MRASLARIVLWPLSKLYGGATAVRNKLYDSAILPAYRSRLPVISIGNITVGGTGKTPLCIWLSDQLKMRGYRPVILSRGYGAKVNAPVIVKADSSFEKVGDEPLLMAQLGGVPVVVSPDRSSGTRLIERQQIGDIIVLDDGLQHRALARSLDIVTINVGSEEAVRQFFAGELLPLGRFRENPARALARAKIVVLSHRKPALIDPELELRIRNFIGPDLIILHSILIPGEILPINRSSARLTPRDILALSGIANPEGFELTLDTLGFNLVHSARFKDHHSFTAAELKYLSGKYPNVPIVCTPKDAVRIRSLNLELPIYELCSSIRITPETKLWEVLEPMLPKISREAVCHEP